MCPAGGVHFVPNYDSFILHESTPQTRSSLVQGKHFCMAHGHDQQTQITAVTMTHINALMARNVV